MLALHLAPHLSPAGPICPLRHKNGNLVRVQIRALKWRHFMLYGHIGQLESSRGVVGASPDPLAQLLFSSLGFNTYRTNLEILRLD